VGGAWLGNSWAGVDWHSHSDVALKCAKCDKWMSIRSPEAKPWITPIQCNVTFDQYCDSCWRHWIAKQFLKVKLSPLDRFSSSAQRSHFSGSSVHVLQIGLGYFGTFLHRDVPWLEEFLKSVSSHADGEPLRAIGVDPVQECLAPLQKKVSEFGNRTDVSLLCGAIGETSGWIEVICVPRVARLRVRRELEKRNASYWTRLGVDMNMAYLENMSTVDVGLTNTLLQHCLELVKSHGKVAGELLERRRVQCFTFAEILNMHDATGCEVLVIDAEGYDCAIIRSLIEALRNDETKFVWPLLIQFETCGHANKKDQDYKAEENTVIELQKLGYLLLYAGNDSLLAHKERMDNLPRFSTWLDDYFKLTCSSCAWQLLPSHREFSADAGHGYEQWRGAAGYESMPRGTWTCKWCMS